MIGLRACVERMSVLRHTLKLLGSLILPSSTDVLTNCRDYFGDYDASIEELLEKQEKKAKQDEGEELSKLNQWKQKYDDIQKKVSIIFRSI